MRPKAVSERPDCLCCCHQRGSPQQLKHGARCRGGAACSGQTGLSGVHDGPVAAMTQMLGVSCQRCRVLVVGILLAARPASRGSAAFIAPRSHGRMPRPSRCAGASAPVSHDDGRGEADARPKSSSRRCIGSDGSRQTRPRAATAGRDTKVAGRANARAADARGARALGVRRSAKLRFP
jgi:hypothetical protein